MDTLKGAIFYYNKAPLLDFPSPSIVKRKEGIKNVAKRGEGQWRMDWHVRYLVLMMR